MSNGTGITWKFLVVEDKEEFVRQLGEAIPSFVAPPDSTEARFCTSFAEAMERMRSERFDILILDLKDDSRKNWDEDEDPSGLKAFEELKKTRFAPVVFYTALAHKVRSLETPFLRVVEKTEAIGRVKEEVQRVLATRLPALSRQMEEIQRQYMWNFVGSHWKDFTSPHAQADIAYLLARRLSLALEGEARQLAQKAAGSGIPQAAETCVHPMQIYAPPPIADLRHAGDVLHGEIDGVSAYWLILTPSCDFAQAGRLHQILVAQCLPLTGETEYLNWKQNPAANAGPLKSLIGDNRQNTQSERFKFLPGTYFLPDLVVDFQRLKSVTPDKCGGLQVVATLDSPFAEAVLARFARYFGRLGTPDIDKNVVIDRIQASLSPPP